MHLPRRISVKKLFKSQTKVLPSRKTLDIAELQNAQREKKAVNTNPARDITQIRIEEQAKKVKERSKAKTKKYPVQKPRTFLDRLLGRY